MLKEKILENLRRYRFELRHITVLFIVLIFFQIILSMIQNQSLKNFLDNTQSWYQQDSAEKIAHLATTSLELLLENIDIRNVESEYEERKLIQSFNIIFSQQLLEKNIEDICLIVSKENNDYIIDDGANLYNYLSKNDYSFPDINDKHKSAFEFYQPIKNVIEKEERLFSQVEGKATFHTYVPFVPNGEYRGVVYIRKKPDFENITAEIISSYEETAIIYSSLILLGLLAMYYISSYSVKERDKTQKLLYDEKEMHLKEQIVHEKESLFTKRIYHTHHKAEKIMGFVKEDLQKLGSVNPDDKEVIERIAKYSNFISRVIYDMKWYEPPIHTIRGNFFNTDINELIRFLVDNIFLRISSQTESFSFKLDLDENLPPVNINQFVVWEVLEPLIQNCIDHANVEKNIIGIATEFNREANYSLVKISDNGNGIHESLLKSGEDGIKKIFSENTSTKEFNNQNTGYGCYIAHQIAVKRCGWFLDSQNNPDGGAEFLIKIKN